MAPARFNSVRQKSSSAVRAASFRDDTNLIALSYDKTVAADPPVPIPARNPMRSARPRSERPASSRPIIVSPPLAPPTEQHPAFRNSFNPSSEERKRDSGLAPTSPTSTLREEGDDYLAQFKGEESLKAGLYASEALHVEMAKTNSKLEQAGGDTTWASDRPAAARGQGPVTTQSIPEEEPVSCPSSPSSARSLARSSTLAGNSSPARSFIRRSFSLRSLATTTRRGEGTNPDEELPSMASSRQASSPAGTKATTAIAGPLAAVPPEGSGTGPLEHAAQQPRIRGSSAEPQAPQHQEQQHQHQHQPPRPSTPTSPKTSPAARFWLRASRLPRRSPSTSTDPDDGTDPDTTYSPLTLTTNIPTDSLLEDDFLTGLSFSQRGSIMLGGQRAFSFDGPMDPSTDEIVRDARHSNDETPVPTSPDGPAESAMTSGSAQPAPAGTSADTNTTQDNATTGATSLLKPDIRVMAADVERESEKVRSLYAAGDALNWEDGAPSHTFNEYLEPTLEASGEDDEDHDARSRRRLTPGQSTSRSGSVSSQQREAARKETELAGGIEDWEDVDGANVDRYGFIEPPRIVSRPSSRMGTPTSLKSSQFSPRKRNVLQKRDAADFASPLGVGRAPSRKVSRRSLNTQHSGMSTTSVRSQRSVMRQAGNLLPHNRGRRWMDEAGDMLTTSPSVHDLAEEAKMDKISEGLKRKEWERSEKWRKMAKNVKKGVQGEGMEFEFDIHNPKLIERTWKGIPDRWRGAAWWSFLAEHAKADDKSPSEDSIIADFHRLQKRASPDDVQIDLDVPRTINRHIMFRRRYRGGQRLMFRVLHALSLYFPDTGYVQGMASLAATLLCYFDEEKCFVMLVRMWQLRGLEYLYRPGFEGLLAALKDFDSNWLNKDVADKLSELCIDNTAYGTRWYLTLFNLSIPFAAQLRVWDVFLLMGSVVGTSTSGATRPTNGANETPGGLDVLHATSAALIQALREVLLDSDFENAMKALTSWIPIKDEDMLMKVTKAEWKAHQGKKKG